MRSASLRGSTLVPPERWAAADLIVADVGVLLLSPSSACCASPTQVVIQLTRPHSRDAGRFRLVCVQGRAPRRRAGSERGGQVKAEPLISTSRPGCSTAQVPRHHLNGERALTFPRE